MPSTDSPPAELFERATVAIMNDHGCSRARAAEHARDWVPVLWPVVVAELARVRTQVAEERDRARADLAAVQSAIMRLHVQMPDHVAPRLGFEASDLCRADGERWPCGHSLERSRHRQFRALRVSGEWFRKAPLLMDHVGRVRLEHGILLTGDGPIPGRGVAPVRTDTTNVSPQDGSTATETVSG